MPTNANRTNDTRDPVGKLPIHHATPADPEFGARTFDSDHGSLTGAHTEYWDRNTKSLSTFGEIAAGKRR